MDYEMKRGMPRPRSSLDHRLPIPYVAVDDTDLGSLHMDRSNECALNDLCTICGEHIGDETCWIAVEDSNFVYGDTGVSHIRCGRMAARLCPHLSIKGDGQDAQDLQLVMIKTSLLNEIRDRIGNEPIDVSDHIIQGEHSRS